MNERNQLVTMTSRLGQKAVGIAAIVAIILLITLIVLLWTGVGAGVFSTRSAATQPPHSKIHRIQPQDMTTLFSGLDIVTSSGTLLKDKMDDYIRGTDRSKAKKISIDGNSHAQVEYVKPLKTSPPPLHEQDLLYAEDTIQSHQPPLRHHSGHFRHRMAQLWDPHPEYEFAAFGRRFHLTLAHDSGFVHPELQVTHVWHNMTIREHPGLRPNGCFYTGSVRGDPHSRVAVSLCHGMTGHIRTSTGSYFIEPAENWRDHTSPILHAVYRLPGAMSASNNAQEEGLHQCGVVDDADYADYAAPANMLLNRTQSLEEYVGQGERPVSRRTKRSSYTRSPRSYSQEYFVEIMVVADKKMAEYHGDGLHHYILTLMSIVAQIYKDASVGNPVSVAVVKVLILKEMEFVMRDNRRRDTNEDGISAAEMLRKFCEWQSSVNTYDDNSMDHHDTALLLTRENICRNPERRKCDTLGLAELGKMCDNKSSCAIVQDNGLSAAFTIAHELGHVLNMPHDDDQKCSRFRDGSKVHNVMSRMLDSNTYPWAWSNCSRYFLTEFLDTGNGRCLLDTPFEDLITADQERNQTLPGESFTEDRQCQLVFGESSKICSYMPVCKQLWCTTDMGEQSGCRTQYMPWADGTPCKAGRWCQKGECVVKTVLKKVDGNWGQWKPYGECSRTCGGGIKKSVRHCNKPEPSNGGRYCTGRRERYRSCGTRECPLGSKGYREEQCSIYNNNNFNIQGLPHDVKWVPKYGVFSPEERCKLYCRVSGTSAYYPLKEKVIDGTPCGPDTFDICVNGICRQAGCNHILGSSMKLDMCGKCGGDNSTCVPIHGSYNNSTYGYKRVVIIPAGSSNLDIRQYGHKGTSDDNYLALVDKDSGEYILNGNYMVSIFRKLLLFGEATLEYTGSHTVVERVNSSSRPLKKDLILEVLSVGKLNPPNITFQYTVQRATQYKWEIRDKWTPCDKVCYGERWQVSQCVRIDNGDHVSDEHCAGLEHQERFAESCNTHCVLKWRTWPLTDCSSLCGRGTQTLGVQCVQQFHDPSISDNTVHNSSCAHISKPAEVIDCEGPCNATHWDFGNWSQCSKTCGGGIQTRSAQCVNERGWTADETICRQSSGPPVVDRPCGMQDCPQWVTGEFSPCSVTCGVGERKNSLWCQMGNRVVAASYCMSQPVPHYKEICRREPCASWQHGHWQQCSVTCGVGVSVRSVTCRSLEGKLVNESSCSSEEKPASSQPCSKKPCHAEISSSLFPSTSTTTSINLPADEESNMSVHSSHNVLPTSYPLSPENSIPHADEESNSVLVEPHRYSPWGTWKPSEWSMCSVTCGLGVRQRSLTCVNAAGLSIGKEYCTREKYVPTEEPCRKPSCARWTVDDWKCSANCGKGIATREVLCVDSRTNAVLASEDACFELGLARPEGTKECYTDCSTITGINWRTGPWGECSKSCGTGYMMRMVACPTDEGECNKADKPVDRTVCNTEPCPPTWNVGAWSQCNQTCGDGAYRHRQVRCQSHLGEVVADGLCSSLERPEDHMICHVQDCHNTLGDATKQYEWRTSVWSQCSKTCGKGEHSRRVMCAEVSASHHRSDWRQYKRWHAYGKRERVKLLSPSDVVVPDYKCDNSRIPKSVRGCHVSHCPYSWVQGEWSECSQSCGEGVQRRSVQCRHYGNVVAPNNCNRADRPIDERGCINSDCKDEYYWVPGEWQPCTHVCGRKGRQQRHLYCHHRDRKKVTRSHCSRKDKPQRKRKCNQEKCRFMTCLDVQQKLHANEDKEYNLQIEGVNISIYCHGMSTDSPQEYLSLPAGENENFSEIYDRRLISPDECPNNGQRRDNCHCVVDAKGKAGLTVYNKVRLNITSLRVITQDSMFSRQVKGQRVAFGEAGDCYSKSSCPQGRFSINLSGTGFFISSLTRWESLGSFSSKKIQWSQMREKVSGKCGGYCGTCSPQLHFGLKLDVLPP